jgi:hypothetical protein
MDVLPENIHLGKVETYVLYSQPGCRSQNFIAYYERLTGTMVGFEKVGKRRVPFAVQCKYIKCTIQPYLKYYLLVVN